MSQPARVANVPQGLAVVRGECQYEYTRAVSSWQERLLIATVPGFRETSGHGTSARVAAPAPTLMVSVTAIVPRSMTETVPDPEFATYAR